MNEWIGGWVSEWLSEWVGEWGREGGRERASAWLNECEPACQRGTHAPPRGHNKTHPQEPNEAASHSFIVSLVCVFNHGFPHIGAKLVDDLARTSSELVLPRTPIPEQRTKSLSTARNNVPTWWTLLLSSNLMVCKWYSLHKHSATRPLKAYNPECMASQHGLAVVSPLSRSPVFETFYFQTSRPVYWCNYDAIN